MSILLFSEIEALVVPKYFYNIRVPTR